jgi:hypothetical protein
MYTSEVNPRKKESYRTLAVSLMQGKNARS